jgi:hypothetical protein
MSAFNAKRVTKIAKALQAFRYARYEWLTLPVGDRQKTHTKTMERALAALDKALDLATPADVHCVDCYHYDDEEG